MIIGSTNQLIALLDNDWFIILLHTIYNFSNFIISLCTIVHYN